MEHLQSSVISEEKKTNKKLNNISNNLSIKKNNHNLFKMNLTSLQQVEITPNSIRSNKEPLNYIDTFKDLSNLPNDASNNKLIFKNEFYKKSSQPNSELNSPLTNGTKDGDYFSKLFVQKNTYKNSLSDLEENDLIILEQEEEENEEKLIGGFANISFKKTVPPQQFNIHERLTQLIDVKLEIDSINTSGENLSVSNSDNISRVENNWSNKRAFGTRKSNSPSVTKMDTNNTMNFLITNNSINMLKMTNSISNDIKLTENNDTNFKKNSSKFNTECIFTIYLIFSLFEFIIQ